MAKGRNNQRKTRETNTEQRFKVLPPLLPKNDIQKEYIDSIHNSPYTLVTGHPGTGKTYIPTRIASLWLKQNAIKKIVLVRPAASASESLGFFKGTKEDKMKQWLQPILSTLRGEFPPGHIDYMLKEEIGLIDFVPLETAKGNSWDDSFIIVDEAEDCNLKEIKTLMTRLGKNSTMVICGDINQVDIEKSGLGEFIDIREDSDRIQRVSGWIDFNQYDDIVRSDAVKQLIQGWDEVTHV